MSQEWNKFCISVIGMVAYLIAIFASVGSMIFWIILTFFNPYTNVSGEKGSLVITFIMLVAPAFLAFYAVLAKKSLFLFVSFVWSLPLSLYMAMAPSMFKLFIISPFCYLISGTLMVGVKRLGNKGL